MKIHTYSLAALALVISGQGVFAAEPSGPSYNELLKRVEQLEKKVDDGSHGAPLLSWGGNKDAAYYVQAEAAITQPIFGRNSAYLNQDGTGAVSNVEFDFDYEVTPRIEFGYIAPTSELGWRARFWHYEADSSAPPHVPVDDAIVVGVGGTGLADLDAIDSTNFNMEMSVLDLELTQQISSGLISYGLRAQMNTQEYTLVDADEGTLDSEMDTYLFGPTAAIELSRPIANTNLTLYGNARASAMLGQREIDTISDDGDASSTEDIIKLNGVLGAGVIWEPELINENLDGFYMNFGVEASYWQGLGALMNNNTGPEDDLEDIIGGSAETDSDFTTLSFIIGVGWKW